MHGDTVENLESISCGANADVLEGWVLHVDKVCRSRGLELRYKGQMKAAPFIPITSAGQTEESKANPRNILSLH